MKIVWQGDEVLRSALSLFERAVSDFKFADKFREGVIVALSGGSDSVFLLLCMKRLADKYKFPLCASHVNHHIRKEEAERDAEFCRELCADNSIDFYRFDADVPAIAREKKQGLEEAARNVRYAFFNKLLSEHPEYKYILTAHNATDNAETVIFNMIRGASARAMCGIPPIRDNILRPLIYISKGDIVDVLSHNNIKYLTDSTNEDIAYTRNFIRKEIIPKCYHINPAFESAIQRLNKNMRTDLLFIEKKVEDFCKKNNIDHRAKKEAFCFLDFAVLSRVIQYMYEKVVPDKEQKLSFSHIEKIMEIIDKEENIGMSYHLPYGIVFTSTRKYYSFQKNEQSSNFDFCLELKDGENKIPNSDAVIYLTDKEDDREPSALSNFYKLSIKADISSAKINGKLYARSKRDGDCYRYGNITHKLKKLFNDAKLSKAERQSLPIICDDDGIVWVPGFGVREAKSGSQKNEYTKLYVYYHYNGGKDE